MASSTKTRSPSALNGLRRGAFLGYQWVLLAFLLAGVAQIFLAGLGVFSLEGHGVRGDTASRRTATWGSRWPASPCSSWCSR
jgi:hypothetical protein